MAGYDNEVADNGTPRNLPPSFVHTGGGSFIEGDVNTQGGDFVNGDQYVITENVSHDVAGLPNPYFGLNAYRFQDRMAFGGRAKAIQEAVEKLTQPGSRQPVLFVTGASGCGKSSFVMAGLLPELEVYYQARHKKVRWAVLRPASNPVAMLVDALQQMELAEISPAELQCLSPAAFWQFIGEKTGPEQVNLLAIDQFEECFTQAGQAERQWLLDCLTEPHNFELTHTHVILTLRSDYLNEVFAYPALWETAKSAMELRGMAREEIKEAIQQPLRALGDKAVYPGKRFEPLLLDHLARDASEDATYLPLLQVTLHRLWQRGRLTADGYQQLTDAIQEHAELVYSWADHECSAPVQPRTADEQSTLIDILLDLVRVSPDDDPRHDVRFRRVKTQVENGSPLRSQIIADLISARLLSISSAAHSGEAVEWIDIIHESLLTNWPRLSQAIAEKRDTLRQRARFEGYLEEWRGGSRSDDYLLSDIHLAEAEKLNRQNNVALSSPDAREFFQRSIEKKAGEARQQLALERKAHQRTQALAAVLLLIAVAAIGTISFPYFLSLLARGEMIQIEAGPVTVGPDARLSRPQQVIKHLDAFKIDRYEVTNAQYRLCVRAGACSNPSNPLSLSDQQHTNYPVTGVSAVQASAFCHWVGGRLPTEIEWERAARGADGRTWPWGEEDLSPQRANVDFDEGAELQPVGSKPDGCTPENVCDLIGNASEITSSWKNDLHNYDPDDTWSGILAEDDFLRLYLIYRGFDYISAAELSQASSALFAPFYQPLEMVGFRCAR